MKTLILHTDASYDSETKTAAVACKIYSTGVDIEHSRILTGIMSAGEAELMAIKVGLLQIRNTTPTDVDTIVIYSDCMEALCRMSDREKYHDGISAGVRLAALLLEVDFGIKKIVTKHIKGHTDIPKNIREHSNNWCDNTARARLRGYLTNFKKK